MLQTLQDLLLARGTLTEIETKIIGKQIVRGVGHLHDCGFLHRDLKPENIVFAAGMVPKVIDLGFALRTAMTTVNGIWGTDGFIAPEVVAMREHSRAMDIWSIGALFFIMLFGAAPKLTKEGKLSDETLTYLQSQHISLKAKDILNRALARAKLTSDIHYGPPTPPVSATPSSPCQMVKRAQDKSAFADNGDKDTNKKSNILISMVNNMGLVRSVWFQHV
ncbi:Serine/threonine-protein kinase dclk1 [Linnemannia exigua]|uniref:Serine/threonine-protein kinase dclk1 n=1 Tax=Linnemannia exigua TaxID=604196 RepID=A0AAD4HA26_9FUNG|nr:Serine/threonine-protein kinase dclk1 [Linnemannia exigua]